MTKTLGAGVFQDEVAGAVFDGQDGVGGVGLREEYGEGIFSTGSVGGNSHATGADGDDGAAAINDAGFCVEGAIAVIDGTIDDDGAAVEIEGAVAIDAVAGGINVNFAAVDVDGVV